MHDEHPHPLLAQVPLTLSPFLSLPTSVPLPYSYKSLPSTLPPSILSQNVTSTSTSTSTADQNRNDASASQPPSQQNLQNAYVVSSSGTTASPDTILSSCIALQQHLQKLEEDARRMLGEWEDRRRAEDLAEKRRVAPGWLDSGVHILKPENVSEQRVELPQRMDVEPSREKNKEGEELDRMFGGLQV